MGDDRELATGRRGTAVLTGDLRRTLFLLALPVLAEQFLNSFVGFVDLFLSGHLSDPTSELNRHATSAIGIAAYMGWLATMLFGFVGVGTTALVSRHWGANEHDEANRIANRSIALSLVLGVAVCLLFFLSAPWLARFLEMEGARYEIAVRYLRIDAFGHIFSSLSMIGAAALRGTGNTRSPMFILGMVSVLNLIISPLLVFGPGPIPELGIDGIVVGTVVARCSGGLLMVIALARGISGLKLLRTELTLRGEPVRRILRIGLPAGIDGAVLWFGQLLFLKIINKIGSVEFAAHVVGVQVEAITFLPAVAWGFAAATMTGQALGDRNPERARRVGREAVVQCSLLAAVISVLFFVGSGTIYEFMHRDAAVIETGIPAMRFLAFFQVPLVISIIFVHALRGAGDTRFPMLINLFGTLCIRIPGAYLFGVVLEGGLIGAWIGMCADIIVRAVLVAVRHTRGRWVTTKV